ncbi:flagellar basal-body rod protein FlgF [Desulfolutivibrio sulfoxidireducens]|uniref:flagellar basal-body rod protein FlgF n=1 Tax=Desulfolutivibrio sulfoxidireducens TaxID=2773299 RepID=UPI00159E08E8|nr:flagellar basal-body rod protein FlgF [Desulfolutivibrio sulfoxidireducens]QLA16866.1 flagellar basal-body rod protein FlgF [Desulfolutivibrio sulfoxidireducens]QLA20431.1 flagellar basal-body rod protein FlgF [Desulfolutivibrio sulfoxidireducens]
METSMYSALFGALSNEMRLTISANNLANINTTGYKRDRVSFQDTFQRFAHDYNPDPRENIREEPLLPKADLIAKPRLAMQQVDFTQGALAVTGNTFDLAIQGPGFFRVRTPDGDFLTRNGAFLRGPDGSLMTNQGFQVLGQGGTIDIPSGKTVTVAGDGQIFVDGAPVATIDVVDVADTATLEKYGDTLFQGANGSRIQEAAVDEERTQIVQGYLEKPNVEVVEEMVAMIETQRSFEAYQKIMTGSSDLDSRATKVGSEK